MLDGYKDREEYDPEFGKKLKAELLSLLWVLPAAIPIGGLFFFILLRILR